MLVFSSPLPLGMLRTHRHQIYFCTKRVEKVMAFSYLNADIHYFVAQSLNYFAGDLDLLQNSGETFIPVIR